jgi:hypothetical protein
LQSEEAAFTVGSTVEALPIAAKLVFQKSANAAQLVETAVGGEAPCMAGLRGTEPVGYVPRKRRFAGSAQNRLVPVVGIEAGDLLWGKELDGFPILEDARFSFRGAHDVFIWWLLKEEMRAFGATGPAR